MYRCFAAGLLVCLIAGCTQEAPQASTAASGSVESKLGARREWPARQASHVARDRAGSAPLDISPDDERAFADELGKLAATAAQLESFSDFEAAVEARREILEKLERRFGTRSWQATNGRLALAHAQRLAELTFEERARLPAIGEAERWSASLAEQGKPREALEEAQRAITLTREVWGDEYYLTANRWLDAAHLHRALGENEQAEALYERTLNFRRKCFGREHPDYVAVLNALAVQCQMLAQFNRAEKLLREAAELDGAIWGKRHPAYATQLNNLGMLYHAAAKPSAAAPLLEESAEIRREAMGADHALYAHSLYNLGSVYYAAEKYEQAAPQFEAALPIFERDLGPGHQMTLLAKNNLAMVELARKNLEQAEKLLQEVVETVREHSGMEDTSYAAALSQLAIVYSHQANYNEADGLLAQAQEVQEKALGENHPLVGKTLELRAGMVRRANRVAEADRFEARAHEIARLAKPVTER